MIKILAILIFVSSSTFAYTLEEYNEYIKDAKIPWIKQSMICERDARINPKNEDVKECLKAAGMVLALKEKKLDAFESEMINVSVEKTAAEFHSHAGVIYEAHGDYKNAIIMYEKAAIQKYPDAIMYLGILYGIGEGVPENHRKAFQYFKEASALGHEKAQQALQALCKNSPWACK